jgi:hypothetical protein
VRDELRTVFAEMDGGTCLEPTDEEFALAVRERALNRTAEEAGTPSPARLRRH